MKEGVLQADPFETLDQSGVGELIKIAVQRGREQRPELHIGICGKQLTLLTSLCVPLFAHQHFSADHAEAGQLSPFLTACPDPAATAAAWCMVFLCLNSH